MYLSEGESLVTKINCVFLWYAKHVFTTIYHKKTCRTNYGITKIISSLVVPCCTASLTYTVVLIKSFTSWLFKATMLCLSQWCWEGSGTSNARSMASMVEWGIGMGRFMLRSMATDWGHWMHTSANPRESVWDMNYTISTWCHKCTCDGHAVQIA